MLTKSRTMNLTRVVYYTDPNSINKYIQEAKKLLKKLEEGKNDLEKEPT